MECVCTVITKFSVQQVNMLKRCETGLNSFFVFNSTFGPREGEEDKKILFYYPTDVELDTKIRQIGLCEAVIKFTLTFTDTPSESLHTQQTRQLFFQPEPDFWMVLTVNVPYIERPCEGTTSAGVEYQEDDVQDHVYQAVLRQSYNTFRLFNGTFQHITAKVDVSGLKIRLEHFFLKFLPALRLSQTDILDVFNGIQFQPLDKNTYLRVQCFINQLEATIPEVLYSILLYNDSLVWSGLEQDDIRVLYSYLTTSLFPACIELECPSRFLLGPPNMADKSNIGRIPRVHLSTSNSADEAEECFLIVYRLFSATICLLVKGNFQLTFNFLKRVDQHLEGQLGVIASDIAENCAKRPPSLSEVQFKYVYFNHTNLAQKTSMHGGCARRSANIPADILRLISDVNLDLNVMCDMDDGELIAKTSTDCWVVGKRCDKREVYVVISHKNANLIEINEEVKKLCAAHFGNIFFLD